jgi:hypothetical protein
LLTISRPSFFNQFLSFEDEFGFEDDDRPNVVPADFFREVLSTYRLIFGQHEDARALMEKYSARGRLLGFKSPFYDAHPSAFVKDSSADPLLNDICLKDSRNLPLFIDLDMLDLKNVYALNTDFPFFAKRLSLLNQFVHNQLPQDWQVSRRERRNLSRFWTIWTKTILNLPMMVMTMIQVVLGGVQVYFAKRAESALPSVSDEAAVRRRAVGAGNRSTGNDGVGRAQLIQGHGAMRAAWQF